MKKKRKIKKVNTKKANTKRANDNDKIEIESPAKKAISVIIALAFGIFIFMSNMDMCGGLGEFIKKILLSLFGTMGYFFPIIFLCMALFILFSERKISKLKNISLILAYIALLSLLHLLINDDNGMQFAEKISHYIEIAQNSFSFEPDEFSGGIIGTVLAEGLRMFIGKAGGTIVLSAIFVIALVLFTGIKFYGQLIIFVFNIVSFIPKMIIKIINDRKADEEIARENEEILNRTINKKNNVKFEYDEQNENILDGLNIEKNNNVLDSLDSVKKENQYYNTDNIDIKPEDIQKRFVRMESEQSFHRNIKDDLLDKMKKESVNEIVYNNKDIKADDFFYNNELYKDDEGIKEEELPNEDNYTENVESEEYNEQVMDNVEDEGIVEDNIVVEKTAESKNIKSDIDNKEKASKDNDEYKVHTPKKRKNYKMPPIDYLKRNTERTFFDKDLTKSVSEKLTETLAQFGVGVVVTDVSVGPTVTRYELQPNLGVKVSKVLSLQDDIKLALAASDIRIEAPIPGKSAIGIEVPNKKNVAVLLGDLIANKEFKEQKSPLTVCIGKDIAGKNIYCDISKMPHLLVAGATGSGKSVCINSMIMSILYKASPKDVRMILVDPKVVELQVYNDIPHLLIPVVTDPNKANIALNWAVNEMTKRYKIFAEKQVKDLAGYNQLIDMQNKNAIYEDAREERMPNIVIIIDELSDLMMACGKSVENSIVRLAQLSRACGIHLVIATQRPSVNVVTGLIKANVPSRIAFAVSSGVDSRTILDMNGAEDLLGHGDMLYSPSSSPKPTRVQGCFVSEKEIKDVVEFVKDSEVEYDESIVKPILNQKDGSGDFSDEKDEMFYEAGKLCIETKQPSIGLLQRKFRMGFNRAARVIDQLEQEGVVSAQDGKKPRDVIMTLEEFDEKFGQ